jgi:hypothetical protein
VPPELFVGANRSRPRGSITPRLAQCSLVTPTMPFSGGGALQHTYNTPDHYLVQTASGGLVLGGGVDALEASGEMTPNQTIGVVDDSTTIEVLDKGTPARASLWKLCTSDRPLLSSPFRLLLEELR